MPATLHRPDVPEGLPVWRGNALLRSGLAVLPTGHAALDAQLPGGGWPTAGLVEVLQVLPVQHEWALLAPALAALVRRSPGLQPGPVVLVGAPGVPVPPRQGWDGRGGRVLAAPAAADLVPFCPGLAARGLPPERLLWVQAGDAAARLWACEQALRCADVPAVLAWLPTLGRTACGDALRRLHIGAMEHGKPLFVFRPEAARHASSAAPLRLLLEGDAPGIGISPAGQEPLAGPPGHAVPGAEAAYVLRVHVLKRRGPPLASPVLLPAQPARLAALLAARQPAATVVVQPDRCHALDRAVAA
jgi:protein ImuA